MKTEDNESISAYLTNTLSDQEKKAFEQRLAEDKHFFKAFRQEQQLFNTLSESSWSAINPDNEQVKQYKALFDSESVQQVKETVAQESKNYHKRAVKKAIPLWSYFVGVAAVVLLFFALQNVFKTTAPKELYASYFKQTKMPALATRGVANTSVKALQLFRAKDYQAALALFNQASKPDTAALLLYKGVCQMELTQFDTATQTFDRLINSSLLDAEKGYWYKALLLLKQDKRKEAKTILKQIIAKKQYNYLQAEALLKEL